MIRWLAILVATVAIGALTYAGDGDGRNDDARLHSRHDAKNYASAVREVVRGKEIFRYDTLGNESFWGGTLRLHEAIAGSANGGGGSGVSPETALAVGLKVDVDALPSELRNAMRKGRADLTNPATTLALLKLDAVVGVRGFFDESGQRMQSIGITCALCHSDVDNSFGPGIGQRRDGWAARDLNVGAIIALSPNVQPFVDLLGLVNPAIDADTVRAVLRSWGPGKFDAELLMDGKAFRPDGKSAAALIPPAFGLAGVNLHTWNGFVANLEMQGQGTFYDPRLNDASKFPIAALAGFADVRRTRIS